MPGCRRFAHRATESPYRLIERRSGDRTPRALRRLAEVKRPQIIVRSGDLVGEAGRVRHGVRSNPARRKSCATPARISAEPRVSHGAPSRCRLRVRVRPARAANPARRAAQGTAPGSIRSRTSATGNATAYPSRRRRAAGPARYVSRRGHAAPRRRHRPNSCTSSRTPSAGLAGCARKA